MQKYGAQPVGLLTLMKAASKNSIVLRSNFSRLIKQKLQAESTPQTHFPAFGGLERGARFLPPFAPKIRLDLTCVYLHSSGSPVRDNRFLIKESGGRVYGVAFKSNAV
ncbi:MAG: hypothetical protein LBC53_04710 [Spirochaetaceae bacterium]|jgi:hypothetical protein|nr:hypothetical protein [Spirochaetaceae bacterium]